MEVKDHRYKIHPTESIILRKPNPLLSLTTKYEVQNETQNTKNQKVVENKGDLEVKIYPRKKNNQSFNNNQISNHLIVLVVTEIIG